MDAGPRIDDYSWGGGREPMLRFGPDGPPTVGLMLPLFEEANRTRACGVSILRTLAARGVGGVLPDLPGQGESKMATSATTLATLRDAFANIGVRNVIAIRSGALLAPAGPTWLLSPQSGPDLLRELTRIKGARLDGDPVEVAGNLLSRTLLDELAAAQGPAGARIIRLTGDPRPADFYVEGSPLWRRAEPDNDPVLAERLAADIADWLTTCAA